MLNNDDDLSKAYLLLQELYKIAYQSTYKVARHDLNEWFKKVRKEKNTLLPLIKVTYTLEEWENQIVNSFIISEELGGFMTNGVIEAKNNVSKTMIKISYGMTSFKNLRAKILLGE